LLLRAEEWVVLAAAVLLYAHFHLSWLLFAALLFVPDLCMLGYLLNPRIGSAIYNLGHTLVLPVTRFVISFLMHRRLPLAIATIWTGHIALDRALGYGLKYPSAFKDTHLQHIP
jgi:hypothetical protein